MRCVGVCFLIQWRGTELGLALVKERSLSLKQVITRPSLSLLVPSMGQNRCGISYRSR